MKARAHLGITISIAAAAFVLLPGAAQARTDVDPCTVTVGQNPDGRICGRVTTLYAYQTIPLPGAGPFDDIGGGELAGDYPVRCPAGSFVEGSESSPIYAWAWNFDHWAQDGYWVLWTGIFDYNWPYNPPPNEGYYTIDPEMKNWNFYYEWDARIFWTCNAPDQQRVNASRRAPTSVQAGDHSDDALTGSNDRDALVGLSGNDVLKGFDSDDHLQGGPGDDSLFAGDHNDLVHGRGGADRALGSSGTDDLLTGSGNDFARGGPGDDQLFDDQGADNLTGGPGNDRFSAHDGDRDVIRCGGGEDIALIDPRDVAIDCEHAYRTQKQYPERLPAI